jgi:hypothetical protein
MAPLLVGRVVLAAARAGNRPLRAALLPLGVAVAVFGAINYPAVLDPGAFWNGLGFEIRHMSSGQGPVTISPLDWGFAFHLLHSLLPGLTIPIALFGVGGLVAHLLAWPRVRSTERLLVLTALLFYFSAELSPTKPFPDFMRYMLPVVPPLAVLAASAISRALAANRRLGRLAAVALAAAIAWSGFVSLRLVVGLTHDTRTDALAWLDEQGDPWIGELFTPADDPLPSVALVDIEEERSEGIRFVVSSSFLYEQAFIGCRSGRCDGRLKAYYDGYQRLFSYPYTEIRPDFRTFAYSNPVIRIVDIRSQPAPAGGDQPAGR